MQMLVSVKKPYDSPGLIFVAMSLETHEVGSDLREALFPRIQVEWKGGHLVDDRDGGRFRQQVDVEQITAAAPARPHAGMREDGRVVFATIPKPFFEPAAP